MLLCRRRYPQEQQWKGEPLSEGKEGTKKGPWLHTLADTDEVLNEALELMACRCLAHNNQQSTLRRCLAMTRYFHVMDASPEMLTSHGMIRAVEKGIDRAHTMTRDKRPLGCR